jgi:hypothetical protein
VAGHRDNRRRDRQRPALVSVPDATLNAANAAICAGSTIEMSPSGRAVGLHAGSLMPQRYVLRHLNITRRARAHRGLLGELCEVTPCAEPSLLRRARKKLDCLAGLAEHAAVDPICDGT